jgi:hypothetical protein
MAIIEEINEVLHKIEAKLYPNYIVYLCVRL